MGTTIEQLAKDLFEKAADIAFNKPLVTTSSLLNNISRDMRSQRVELVPITDRFFVHLSLLDDGKELPCPRVTLDICNHRGQYLEHLGVAGMENKTNYRLLFARVAELALKRVPEFPKEQERMKELGFKVREEFMYYRLSVDDYMFEVGRRVENKMEVYEYADDSPWLFGGSANRASITREKPFTVFEILFIPPDLSNMESFELALETSSSLTELLPRLFYGVMRETNWMPRIEFLNLVPKSILDQIISSEDCVGNYWEVQRKQISGSTQVISQMVNGRIV